MDNVLKSRMGSFLSDILRSVVITREAELAAAEWMFEKSRSKAVTWRQVEQDSPRSQWSDSGSSRSYLTNSSAPNETE